MDKNTQAQPKPQYETPKVHDYGTLLELTLAGSSPNRDSPIGANNTAFPPS